ARERRAGVERRRLHHRVRVEPRWAHGSVRRVGGARHGGAAHDARPRRPAGVARRWPRGVHAVRRPELIRAPLDRSRGPRPRARAPAGPGLRPTRRADAMTAVPVVPSPNVLAAHLGDESVLLDLDTKHYFRLNETAAVAWRALEHSLSIEGIIRALV